MSQTGARDGFELCAAVEVLTRTPSVLRALLADLTDDWIHGRVAAESWSPYDVVGHLIHGERTDWVPRMRRILEHGEEVPFEPFDREAHRAASQGLALGELLGTFERLRGENLELMDVLGLDERHLDLAGTHPALGRVTLRQLLATWVAHDLAHVAQVARTMAWRYRDAVGPWNHSDYLRSLAEVESAGAGVSSE